MKVGVQLKRAEYQILLTDVMALAKYLPASHRVGRNVPQ
jgi:hypothetical protein